VAMLGESFPRTLVLYRVDNNRRLVLYRVDNKYFSVSGFFCNFRAFEIPVVLFRLVAAFSTFACEVVRGLTVGQYVEQAEEVPADSP